MKKTISCLLCVLLCIVVMAGCAADATADVWSDATYTADTTLGSGQKTLTVQVQVQEHTVNFTIHTDKDTVGAALQEHGLIDGEESTYGLYIKVVNGITADYDVDKSYWSFYENGQYAMAGADTTTITEGVQYALVYTRE